MLLTTKSGRKVYLPTDEEDAAIAAGIAADPDTFEPTDAQFAAMRRIGRPPKDAPKVFTGIRLDADVLDALRATGKGWQTRVNDVLREWVKAHPQG